MNPKTTIVALLGVLALLGLAGTANARTLTYGTIENPQHVVIKDGIKPFFQRLQKSTGGALTGQVFPSSQLLTGRGALAGIRDGVASSGFVIPAYDPSQLPHITVLSNMVTAGTDPLAIAAALNEVILLKCPDCLADYTAQGALPLVSYNTTNYVLQCDKPIRTLADLQGLKVRSTGAFSDRLKVLGADAVNLSATETAQALERGQVDCVQAPINWLKAYGLQDGVKDITMVRTGSYHGLGAFVINRKLYKDLPADQRQAILKEVPGMLADIMLGQLKQDKELTAWAKGHGIKIIKPAPKFQAALLKTDKDREFLEQRAKAVGVTDSATIAAAFTKSVTKWDAIIDKIGHNRAAYIKALNREIYSKL